MALLRAVPEDRRQKVAKLVRSAWLEATGLALLFVGLALWGPPENWLYTGLGLLFLVVALPVVLYSLRSGPTAFVFTLASALIVQAWLSTTVVPVELMGGGAEFVMQLCVTGGGIYFVLFAFRQPLLRWLFRDGAI